MKESGVMTPDERAASERRTADTEPIEDLVEGLQHTIARLQGIVQLQALHIAKLEAAAREKQECTRCDGTGATVEYNGIDVSECHECDGTGEKA